MGALDGKVAVITGGNSGIGLATAKRFVEEGAYVFITARRQAELDKAASVIGKNVTAIAGNLSRLADIDRIAAAVKLRKGVVDIIVSNAGFTEQAALETVTPQHFDKTFNLMARASGSPGDFWRRQRLFRDAPARRLQREGPTRTQLPPAPARMAPGASGPSATWMSLN